MIDTELLGLVVEAKIISLNIFHIICLKRFHYKIRISSR